MFKTDEGTAEGRQFLWTAAWNMWTANPILGVGAGNSAFLVGRYQPTHFNKRDYLERNWSGSAVHSVFFEVLAEHGTVGIVILGYIIGSHFRTIRRVRRQSASHPWLPSDVRRDAELYGGALAGAVVGFCAAGAFLSVTYYPYLWYLSAMAVALEHMVQREVADVGSLGK
jgi:O-antigen ligase